MNLLRTHTIHLFVFLVFSSLPFFSNSFAAKPSHNKPKSEPSAVREFAVNKKTMKLKALVPSGWEPVVDVMNTPLALLSKRGAQDLRSVIQIVPYGVTDSEDHFTKFRKDPEEYYAQKEEWLDQMNGEAISYEPFEEITQEGSTTYSIGIKYKNDLGQFLDRTFYISSKTKGLFFVKAVIPLDQEDDYSHEVNRVISSIRLEN